MNRDVCEHSVPTHLYCEKCAFLMEFRQLQQTHRREWRSLTNEEIYPLYNEPRSDAEILAFARDFEAALRSKNHE